MPALINQREERFCQLLRRGISRYQAYPQAGYAPNSGAPYRLAERSRVKRRLAELTRSIAVKTQVTVQTISDQLDEDRAFAQKVEQAGPALNASIAKAKLHGLLIDRKESGAPGDFAQQSEADVMALVEKELGAATAAALRQALARQDEPPKPTEPPAPSLDMLRDDSETLN